jgi:ABC-type bacteriocin/lantibiotic exporter with double-glycine peptidase domain
MFNYWLFLLIIIHSVMELVGVYVFFRSAKRKRDQQWEGSSEANMKLKATAAELQKVKGQLQDGAMEGESMPTDVN